MIRITLLLSLLLMLSGCVIDARERDVMVGEPRTIEDGVVAGSTIEIRVPAGEVEITNSRDGLLAAEMIVRCPDLESRCARILGELDFVLTDVPGGVRLALTENRARVFRHGSVDLRIRVPEGHPLQVDVTAGDLDMDVTNCVRLNMEAGDATVAVPRALVRRVDLDAGMGDASLKVDGRTREGRRSMLVGAEVHWDEGDGPCDLVLDLQAGDLRAVLL